MIRRHFSLQFGCCINLGPFVSQVAGKVKSPVTSETVAAALSFLAATGYDFAEMTVGLAMTPPGSFPELAEIVRVSRIPVLAFNGFIPAQLPLVGPARDVSRIRAYLAEACVRMAELGGKLVVFGSGAARRVPDGYSQTVARAELVEFLQLASEAAAPHGIVVVVEPLNKEETNIIHTVADGLALAAQAGQPNVLGLADTYHMEMEKEPVDVLVPLAARLGHVHVADDCRLAPGTGAYDYARLRECLKEGDYCGGISIECRWGDFKEEAPQALSVLRHAWAG